MKNIVFVLFISVFAFVITANAQKSEKFENLKILPKNITKDKLDDIMHSFTDGLGVNCEFCHVRNDDTNKMEFSKDTKTAKNKARIMLTMTMAINNNYLSKLSEYSDNIIQVKCITCHRGNKKPEMLQDVLYTTVDKKGIDEAISTYHKLHDEYYGGFTYDFRDHTLVELVQMLDKDKNYDGAMKFAQLNLEMYPKSGVAFYGLGEVYAAKGDKENAITNYKKAIELMPRAARFLNRKINELGEKK
jgi:tetratricopeptide (TPR) repeat protein